MGVHVEVSGSGPDLALLHGWGMNLRVWDDLAGQLAAHFRVHCVDLPGHGASRACEPYTLDALADALMSAVPPRATVCGWSFGGQVALKCALRHPQGVARLVLIAATPRFVLDAGWEHGIAAATLDDFGESLARGCRGTLRRFVTLQARGDAQMRAVLRVLHAKIPACGGSDRAALSAGLRLLADTDMRSTLRDVAQPVLVIHGARDMLVPPGAGAHLQRTLPRAALAIVAGAAHAPFIAQPRQVARHIVEFCGER